MHRPIPSSISRRACVFSGITLAGLAFVALALVGAPVSIAGDAEWKPITVRWHGQSFFTVITSTGKTLAFDPHLIPAYGRPDAMKADMVFISHPHNDHNRFDLFENAREKNFKVFQGLKGAGKRSSWNEIDEKVDGIAIRNVGVYHDDVAGMQSGKNSIFIIDVDGWKIAHLGDLGHKLTDAQVKAIGPVDVLMIPVGGVYTINGSDAKAIVQQIKPREYVFPMHHGTKAYDDLLPPTEFLDGWPAEQVARSNDNQVKLNRDPQRPRPLVVSLHYAPKGQE